MLSRFWQAVQAMLSEDSYQPLPVATCDLAVSQPDRVHELLQLLEQARQRLKLQSESGLVLGQATVFAVTRSQVTLRCTDGLQGKGPLKVNVAGASDRGAVLFTLNLVSASLGGLWRAPLPAEVLCEQSRQARRVEVARSLGHRAELKLPGLPSRVKLLDLSESGAGLGVNCALTQAAFSRGGQLVLDGTEIRVPRIELVHLRSRREGFRIGLRLEGLKEPEARAMRRWLNQAEADLIRLV